MNLAICKVGQGEECGKPASHLIAVTGIATNAWARRWRKGGVIPLCEFHAATPVVDWDMP